MSINSRCGRTDAAVRAGIAARLAEIQYRTDNATDGPWDEIDAQIRHTQIDGFTRPDERAAAQRQTAADIDFVMHARTEVPALVNGIESVLDYVARCEESGITMQPGDVRRLIANALEVTA